MSKKERSSVWEDKYGNRYLFDYELNGKHSRNNGSKKGSVSIVEGARNVIIYAAYRIHETFSANGKGEIED